MTSTNARPQDLNQQADPWHVVSVDFTCRPEHSVTRSQIAAFAVAAYADKVYRPVTREQVEYTDGVWQYRYEATVIPESYYENTDDWGWDIATALVAEGLVRSVESVSINGKRVTAAA